MAGNMRVLAILFGLISLLFGIAAVSVIAPQANSVTLVSPAACPNGGCAGGQRLNLRADFTVSVFDPARTPNVQVCVYAPINWSASLLETDLFGGVTGAIYTSNISNCESSPSGYNILGGSSAHLSANAFGDSLGLVFRLGSSATTTGSVLVRVLEQDSTGNWQRSGQTINTIPVAPTASVVFVANEGASCSGNSPCYVNSGDDLPGGLGTGLKDAIDSSTSAITIKVLGQYLLKKNTVLVNGPHILTGLNGAGISFQGSDCSQPMLKVTAGASITNLAINSGACVNPLRDLIHVESTSPVSIESNDLTNGGDAIRVTAGNTGSLRVRFNQIQNNSGYGIFQEGGNTGMLDAVANNIFSNRSNSQVACDTISSTPQGVVDHNFWGPAVTSTASAVSACTVDNSKRLGAAIQHNSSTPGVNSQLITAENTLKRYFGDQIGLLFKAPAAAAAQTLGFYVVNHGTIVPFTASQPQATPCSNYWDIFQADSTSPDPLATLELHFKYNLSPSCVTTINLTQFCGQTADSSLFPLFWYDAASNTWIPTGQKSGGQVTTCDTGNSEIDVTLTNNSPGIRPNFGDLTRLPFVVRLPWQGVAPVISDFIAQTGDQKVTLTWSTTSNVTGFYVLRSTLPNDGFAIVSPRIAAPSSDQTYSFIDTNAPLGLVNNIPYYYRLQVINPDNTTALTGVISVIPIPPTPTLTPTRTNTPLPTLVPSSTWTRTPYPTVIFYYRSPTPTRTSTLTPTSPFQTVTNTPLPSLTPMGTLVLPSPTGLSSANPVATPTQGAATQLAEARLTRTAEAYKSPTPTPKPVAKPFTLSLTAVLGILAGVAAVAGVVIYLLRNRLKIPS